MLLYRIAKADYIEDISGTGGLYGPARWHQKGTRILYTSTSEPLARLEVLANYVLIPPNMKLLTLETDELPFERIQVKDLPPNWKQFDPYPPELAQIALEWLQSNKTLGLMVPSIQSLVDQNMLINPMHPLHHRLRIVSVTDVDIDPRIKRGTTRYTVQLGDTLASIATRFYQDTKRGRLILEANRDQLTSPGKLTPGMVLSIPSLN